MRTIAGREVCKEEKGVFLFVEWQERRRAVGRGMAGGGGEEASQTFLTSERGCLRWREDGSLRLK